MPPWPSPGPPRRNNFELCLFGRRFSCCPLALDFVGTGGVMVSPPFGLNDMRGFQTGSDIPTDKQTDRQADRQAGRQTGRQAGRQTDR